MKFDNCHTCAGGPPKSPGGGDFSDKDGQEGVFQSGVAKSFFFNRVGQGGGGGIQKRFEGESRPNWATTWEGERM